MIFVSHSCKDGLIANPPPDVSEDRLARLRFAQRVRDRLAAELDPNGEGLVWFDRKRLDPGDPWELSIIEALHRCTAAVVLLTPDALESPWVLREATILADRRGRWPGLCLVPVLLAGSDYTSLNANSWWRDLQITRWQPVQAIFGAYAGPDADADCEQIVDRVVAQLEQLATATDPALEGWAEEVGSFLQEVRRRQRQARLSEAARSLHLAPPLTWDEHAVTLLATALLRADVIEHDAAGADVYPLMRALAALVPGDPTQRPPTEEEQQLCWWVKPVAAPPAAAVGIAAARAPGGAVQPVAFGAEAVLIAELAVRRATCNRALVKTMSAVAGETFLLSAKDLKLVSGQAEFASMAGRELFVVIRVEVLADDDIETLATDLAAQLPDAVAMVLVVGRDVALPASEHVRAVEVSEEDERACTAVDRAIGYYVAAG